MDGELEAPPSPSLRERNEMVMVMVATPSRCTAACPQERCAQDGVSGEKGWVWEGERGRGRLRLVREIVFMSLFVEFEVWVRGGRRRRRKECVCDIGREGWRVEKMRVRTDVGAMLPSLSCRNLF